MAACSALASGHAVPAIGPLREFASAGGLISYSPSIWDVVRLAGVYIGKVLKGVRPVAEVARRYGALSVLGVEVVAVPPRASPTAIAGLGASPPVLFPVVTDGNEEIVAAYRLFTPGDAHAELLIDRQGYIRAIWRSDQTGVPDAAAVQAQVERLNEEKAPPPLPDDHVH